MPSQYPTALDNLNDEARPSLTHRNVAESVEAVQSTLGVYPIVPRRVDCCTTGNITLSGIQTIDGVAGTVGRVVLVRTQSNMTQNGVYIMQSGAWTRADWADTTDKLVGLRVWVTNGAVWSLTEFYSTFRSGYVIGSNAIDFQNARKGLLISEHVFETGPVTNPVPNTGGQWTTSYWDPAPTPPVNATTCTIHFSGTLTAGGNAAGYWYLYKRVGGGFVDTLLRQMRFHTLGQAWLPIVLDATHEFAVTPGEQMRFFVNASADSGGLGFAAGFQYMTLRYYT